MIKLKLGLIINPLAGIGGTVALKGSDGADIVAEAKKRGAKPLAGERTLRALSHLEGLAVEWMTWGGKMGEDIARRAGLDVRVLGGTETQSTSEDTRLAATALKEAGIDLLVFAGGDGTARDIHEVLGQDCPVLGIPAGCKMHSGVYANNPEDAGHLLERLVKGGLVELVEAEVRDIDEVAFRKGIVRARHYGNMQVPVSGGLLQQVKAGAADTEDKDALDGVELAAFMAEEMESLDAEEGGVDFLMGSGSTVAEIMRELALPNTLLGVDLVRDGECIAADLSAASILQLTGARPLYAVLTVIGGQGHLFGRGNQQLSPDVIRRIGRQRLHVLATPAKLASLAGRPLCLDTGDPALDCELSGWLPIVTGYDRKVLYRVGSAADAREEAK